MPCVPACGNEPRTEDPAVPPGATGRVGYPTRKGSLGLTRPAGPPRPRSAARFHAWIPRSLAAHLDVALALHWIERNRRSACLAELRRGARRLVERHPAPEIVLAALTDVGHLEQELAPDAHCRERRAVDGAADPGHVPDDRDAGDRAVDDRGAGDTLVLAIQRAGRVRARGELVAHLHVVHRIEEVTGTARRGDVRRDPSGG